MNENDKQAFGVEATANPAPSQGRRRLVKGVILATPAILTLRTSFASQDSGPSRAKALASFSCDGDEPVINLALQSFLDSGGSIEGDSAFQCPPEETTKKKNSRWKW